MREWWQTHKRKVYIGLAITTIVIVPFGTILGPAIYYKLKNPPEEPAEQPVNTEE